MLLCLLYRLKRAQQGNFSGHLEYIIASVWEWQTAEDAPHQPNTDMIKSDLNAYGVNVVFNFVIIHLSQVIKLGLRDF